MERIKISNFRKIKDSWDLDLSPITFFTGKNNSGKSSVLKSLMVINDYINSDNHFFLNFDGDFANKHRVKTFDEAKNWINNESKQIKFEFKNKKSTVELVFEDIEEEEYFTLIRQYFRNPNDEPVLDNKRIKRGILNLLKITRSDGKVFSILRDFGLGYQIVVDPDLISSTNPKEISIVDSSLIDSEIKKLITVLNENFKIPKLESLEDIFTLDIPVKLKLNRDWISALELARVLLNKKKTISNKPEKSQKQYYNPSFFLPEIFDSDRLVIDRVIVKTLLQYFEIESTKKNNEIGSFDNKTEANKLLEFSEWVMEQLNFQVFHLSPNRANQSKIYDIRNSVFDINNLLKQYSKSPFFNYDAESFFNDSLEFFEIPKLDFLNSKSGIERVEDNLYTIKLSDPKIGEIHLKDQGYGMGQIFTIIFQVALLLKERLFENKNGNFKKKIIIIEEPEGNLHPKLQSQLTDFFKDVYLSYDIHFILETHSEYMIRNSQLIHLDYLNHKLFKLYYFDENGPYEMEYLNNGKFNRDFGEGFTDIADNIEVEIYKNNIKRK